jgi:phage tail-like protein
MKTRTLLFALLAGVLLALGGFGAWTTASQGASAPGDPLTAARFSIVIDGSEIAAFSELADLSSGFEVDVLETTERGLLTIPSKRHPQSVTLKRGMTSGIELWAWHELVMNGSLAEAQKDVTLVMYDETGTPVARYHLENAWPAKLEIGSLKAGTSSVLMETVTIVSENLQRVSV